MTHNSLTIRKRQTPQGVSTPESRIPFSHDTPIAQFVMCDFVRVPEQPKSHFGRSNGGGLCWRATRQGIAGWVSTECRMGDGHRVRPHTPQNIPEIPLCLGKRIKKSRPMTHAPAALISKSRCAGKQKSPTPQIISAIPSITLKTRPLKNVNVLRSGLTDICLESGPNTDIMNPPVLRARSSIG